MSAPRLLPAATPHRPLRQCRRLPRPSLAAARGARALLALADGALRSPASGWSLRWQTDTGGWRGLQLRLRAGGSTLWLTLHDPAALADIADAADPRLPPLLRVATLAHALAPVLQAVSGLIGGTLVLEAVDIDMPPGDDALGCVLGHGPARCRAALAADDARGWATWWHLGRALLAPRALPALPVEWRLVIGQARLRAGELAGLQPLDALLLQRPPGYAGVLAAGSARRPAARAALDAAGWRLLEPVFSTEVTMTTIEPELNDGRAGEVELTVRFELPRWEATLAEMAALAPGALLDTGADLQDPLVSLWVGRRCIGQGQLVAIGERLAVRVAELRPAPAALAPEPVDDLERAGA